MHQLISIPNIISFLIDVFHTSPISLEIKINWIFMILSVFMIFMMLLDCVNTQFMF
jgi:hypothetical protein